MRLRKLIPPLHVNRLTCLILAGLLLIGMAFFALFLLSRSVQNGSSNPQHFYLLISLCLFGLGGLLLLTLYQIFKLYQRIIHKNDGVRLTVHFIRSILLTALIPTFVIYFFSFQFLSFDLRQTFDRNVTIALEDALLLTRSAVNQRALQALNSTRSMSRIITNMSFGELINNIEAMRRQSGAIELSVFDYQGNIVAFAHQDLNVFYTASPDPAALLRIDQEQEYFTFEQNGNDYVINVFSDINKLGQNPFYLQAAYPMPDSFNTLADSVQQSYQLRQSISYLQPHVTGSLLLGMTLVFALTVLAALWASFLFGERMTGPLRHLIGATKKVAGGDLNIRIQAHGNNDLAALVRHFNHMTASLKETRDKYTQAQELMQQQTAYLQTIIDSMSPGVLTIDADLRLRMYNQNACKLLHQDLADERDRNPAKNISNSYEELIAQLQSTHTNSTQAQMDANMHEITLSRFGERKVLMCRVSDLHENREDGYVIIFDDITTYLQSQRNAAWEEMARRLAHEIKNPLTPIQLASERLRYKLIDRLPQEDAELLERNTGTIINQVQAMKHLVDDFTQFAKPIEIRRQNLSLHQLLRELAILYAEQQPELQLEAVPDTLSADPIQIRQVIHNLMKNAIEANEDRQEGIRIRWRSESGEHELIFSMEDNGSGFRDLDKDPFEPYVSSKRKGSGLGLAIVKKIIREHGGDISAGHSKDLGGALIRIRFPQP